MELKFVLSEKRELTKLNEAGESERKVESVTYDVKNDKSESIGNLHAHQSGFTLNVNTPMDISFTSASIVEAIKSLLSTPESDD